MLTLMSVFCLYLIKPFWVILFQGTLVQSSAHPIKTTQVSWKEWGPWSQTWAESQTDHFGRPWAQNGCLGWRESQCLQHRVIVRITLYVTCINVYIDTPVSRSIRLGTAPKSLLGSFFLANKAYYLWGTWYAYWIIICRQINIEEPMLEIQKKKVHMLWRSREEREEAADRSNS